ncbi:hypothetical protein B0A54_16448 [Friedmanniomyces endolithicus]|uniref:Uncharacterized protein n=1 Tax=Friedmanniomyces endolithicus TaxID=329885 RepID=A0A4U0TY58_9PEZI|nr:hypothetical protein LTS09_016780 [Friedmanniomyces endolithicus]TKA27433.1 hypothetical protein B0A54_16448 [Friedmanniomyces endolithicus]
MTPLAPPRRFAPEPVETTKKSSKDGRQPSPNPGERQKLRRFAVEPLETTVTSSKDHKGGDKPEPRGNDVQPGETEHKSSKSGKTQPRRFPVQPVEMEHKSSKDRGESDDKPVARRFAPQLQEMSTANSKDGTSGKPGHIRFLPEPAGTIHRTNRKAHGEDEGHRADNVAKHAPRKFAPVLIDTAQRSRRAGDDEAGIQQAQKTESSHDLHTREHQLHFRQDQASTEVDVGVHGPVGSRLPSIPYEMRRQLAPMDGSAPVRRPSVQPQRTHSFRCPELDTIESSESERGSNASSLSSSPSQGSPMTASDSSSYPRPGGPKHATRTRESVDENFSHYLLQLEAKKAEQRLRELAEGAFVNTDFHEPVQHYMNRDDESDEMEIEDRPVTYDFEEDMELLAEMAARRESTAKANWEQEEMQRHHEQLEQERNAARVTEKPPQQPSQHSPWWNPAAALGLDYQDSEMRSMRDRARPPMLGADLIFPRCPSPEPARFDITQGHTALRAQMSYLAEQAERNKSTTSSNHSSPGGLWQPCSAADPTPRTATVVVAVTTPALTSPTTTPTKGLWGGFCVNDGEVRVSPSGLTAPPIPSGLLTPRAQRGNPFEDPFASTPHTSPENSAGDSGVATPTPTPGPAPPTPPRSLPDGDLARLDSVLSAEEALERLVEAEFPDSFVTQVYNYLSLGYPALARPFDEELAKISHVSIGELREDDWRMEGGKGRGYIRFGEDSEGGGGEVEVGGMRWRALKLYVREWARQDGRMVHDLGAGGGNFGTEARRGSWAI